MPLSHYFRLVPVTAGLALLVAVIGCSGGADKGGGPVSTGTSTTPPPSGDKTPVEGKGVAVLKGTVSYDGTPPAPIDISTQVKAQADKDHCLKEDPANHEPAKNRNWVVNKDGKVANAVVWVRPPAGKYFKFTEDEKKSWPAEVKVDQPFCHFEPHVSVAFPKYYDGAKKKLVETGQKIDVHNSAPISHNTKWKGDARAVPGGNETLASKKDIALNLAPDWATPVTLNCNIHTWMDGYIWVLETPYAAVSKEDGTFEIKNVPAGAEVMVVTWHENAGFGDGQQGKKMILKEGDNTMDFKVKAK